MKDLKGNNDSSGESNGESKSKIDHEDHTQNEQKPRSAKKNSREMIKLEVVTSFFYLGKFPKGPGTMGTLGAIPLVYILASFGSLVYLSITLVLSVIAIMASQKYEELFAEHDSKEIVIDEVVGFLVTMALLPMTWQSFVLAFVLFRVLDILKPFPINWIDQKINGGVGVVADDIVAGIIANVFLHLAYTHTTLLGVQFVGG